MGTMGICEASCMAPGIYWVHLVWMIPLLVAFGGGLIWGAYELVDRIWGITRRGELALWGSGFIVATIVTAIVLAASAGLYCLAR